MMIRRLLRTPLLAVAVLALFPPLPARGASPAEKNREASTAYEAGDFEEALRLYTDALIDAPESPRLHFNIGVAQYQLERYDEALEEFRSVLTAGEDDLVADAYYNIGNGLYRQGSRASMQGNGEETIAKYEEAIESYVESLKLRPDDVEAKKNIEIIRREIKEMTQLQEQQQDQQQQQQQNQQQQDQEEQQQQQQQGGEENQDEQEEKQQEQAQPGDATPTPQAPQPEGEPTPSYMTPEEAEQFLDNFAREKEDEMRERREQGRRRAGVEADW